MILDEMAKARVRILAVNRTGLNDAMSCMVYPGLLSRAETRLQEEG